MWIIKIFKIQWFYPPRILNEHWCILFLFTNSTRENWFQYVRRVFATAINFPCMITLGRRMSLTRYFQKQLTLKPPFRSPVCFQGTSWPEQHLGPWEKNPTFFSLKHPQGHPRVSAKKFSPIGPTIWPAMRNKYINVLF